MSLEGAILGFLAEKPRTGYDLKTRCFDEQAARFWTADQAQIYRTLERLHSGKLVRCTRKRQQSKPDRKIYELTEAGRRALRLWLNSQAALAPPRDAQLMQVFFSAPLSNAEIVQSLAFQRSAHQRRLEALRAELLRPAELPGLPDRARLLREVAYDGAIAQERAAIDWLDDTIEAVEHGHLPADAGAASTGLAEAGSA